MKASHRQFLNECSARKKAAEKASTKKKKYEKKERRFHAAPKEMKYCQCGCGTPLRPLMYFPYDDDHHETLAAMNTVTRKVSSRAQEFYDKLRGEELCGCGCGKPLEKNDPLGPFWFGAGAEKKLINEDCYFEKFGEEIDKHPIGGPGIHGPKNKGPID